MQKSRSRTLLPLYKHLLGLLGDVNTLGFYGLNTCTCKSALRMAKRALAWYGKFTWESAHAWILKILCYLNVLGITLMSMVRLSFHAIPLLIYDVMNDITIIP